MYFLTVRSMKSAAVLIEEGNLAAQVSLPPGTCHPRQEKLLIPGGLAWGGGGAWVHLKLTDAYNSFWVRIGTASSNYGIGGAHLKAMSFISDPLLTSLAAKLLCV